MDIHYDPNRMCLTINNLTWSQLTETEQMAIVQAAFSGSNSMLTQFRDIANMTDVPELTAMIEPYAQSGWAILLVVCDVIDPIIEQLDNMRAAMNCDDWRVLALRSNSKLSYDQRICCAIIPGL